MAELAHSYAVIIKQEKQEDGTLKVYGKATDDSIDIDQQICDEGWLQEAMPQWFETGGNIREQHSNIAAGVATDYELKSDGHYITAHVVDPVSVKKVEAGVLKGFSIGIRSPRIIRDNKAANGRIVDGQIVEVSLVDRPANPNAKLMLAKAAENGELMAVDQKAVTPADIAHLVTKSDAPAVAVEVETPAVDAEVVEAEVVEPETTDAPEAEAEKSAVTADVKKFDENLFNTAIQAIGDLIAVEAGEAVEGHDESDSIKHLLKAIKHLNKWYRGEAEEGEVANPNPAIVGHDHAEAEDEDETEGIYLAADGDKPAFGEKPDAEKPADDAEAEKCEKCNKSVKSCKCADKTEKAKAEKSATNELAVGDSVVGDIVEKAVQSAKQAVEAELELLKSATAVAEEKAVQLEAQLTDALSKAAAGGPVRTGTKTKSVNTDALLVKATEYRLKASATQDRLLADGYRELADDLEKQARKSRK